MRVTETVTRDRTRLSAAAPGHPGVLVRLGLAAALLLPLGACASTPPVPESEAAREVAATRAAAERTAAEAEAEAAREAPPRSRPAREPVREKLVVVDPGGGERPRTLAELAAANRADRERHGDRSVGELTDENLAELAARGKVTFAGGEAGEGGDAEAEGGAESRAGEGRAGNAGSGGAGGEGTAEAGTDAGTDGGPETCDEVCWRRRAFEVRQAWADTVERIAELEEEVAEQRWRFYATDDPWVRDSRVKPAWDRALDRLQRARDEAERYRQRVAELMEEGRRAGALPGWLREGIHLEPRADEEEAGQDPSEPGEPQILEDYARQPDPP